MSRCDTYLCNDSVGDEAPLPDDPCITEDFACEIEEDNLVGIVDGASNITECLQNDAYEANYVTYFGPSGFPFVDTCLFFNACDILGVNFWSKLTLICF